MYRKSLDFKKNNRISKHIIFYDKPRGLSCICDSLFENFKWCNLEEVRASLLPLKPGVYVIRIKKRNKSPIEVYNSSIEFLRKLKWKEFRKYVDSRLRRLKRISNCPIIYIGAAPTSIRSRYKDLSGVRHTAFYPILALLLNGWELEYGFRIVNTKEEASSLEEMLKVKYKRIHGELPALVER